MSAPLTPQFLVKTMLGAFRKPVILREKSADDKEAGSVDSVAVAQGVVMAVLALAILAFNVYATVKFVDNRIVCASGAAMWFAVAVLLLTWIPVPVLSSVAWVLLVLGAFTCYKLKFLGGVCNSKCK